MTLHHAPLVAVVFVWIVFLLPALTQAQSTGTIAGTVRDTTGAVLPGVTVEAASPALIEKVRGVATDSQGNYKIVDLRPGVYTVTFTLQGFSSLKREGLELTSNVTATVNADLRLGSLEETVTVTGASPVVDVQNTRTQSLFTREVLDALPTGRSYGGYAAMILGASTGAIQDVGGNAGENVSNIDIHGTRGANSQQLMYDGMSIKTMTGDGAGSSRVFFINQLTAQEMVLETGGMGAESTTGGVQSNMVPKDGGNEFHGTVAGAFTNSDLQNDNLNDGIRARGIAASPSKVKQIYDFGGGLGGPIQRDRIWFFAATRTWGAENYVPGVYFNSTLDTLRYTPDLNRQGYTGPHDKDITGRVTWQATSKQKINITNSVQYNCMCYLGLNATSAPEAVANLEMAPIVFTMGTWSYPRTNRLLFQAGGARMHAKAHFIPTGGLDEVQIEPGERLSLTAIPVTELSTGFRYGPKADGLGVTDYGQLDGSQVNLRGSVSYVTGSHAFRAGFTLLRGVAGDRYNNHPSVRYNFRNGSPASLTQYASPGFAPTRQRELGLFAQDEWTIRNVTMNLGVRFDDFQGWVPAATRPAGDFVQEFSFPEITKNPSWQDISPRLGVAYDLFGNGRTALKASAGRYLQSFGPYFIILAAPSNAISTIATRTWSDTNGNFVPDCVLTDVGVTGECGALDNRLFGTVRQVIRYDRDVTEGWHKRQYNWQTSASVQQQLWPGAGLNVGYFRTWYGNINVNENQAVTPADFDPFCVTAPADPRLPDGGGYPICGLFNVSRAKFGLVDEVVVPGSRFGDFTDVYQGVEATFHARFGRGGLLAGGVSTARTVINLCPAAENPQVIFNPQAVFCETTNPWRAQTQVKLNGFYPLPWGVHISGVLQNLPGAPVGATGTGQASAYSQTPAVGVFTNAQIAPSLGRNLSACPTDTGPCTATLNVPMFAPYTLFEPRFTQFDLRLAKVLRLGRTRLEGAFDIYNLFNSAAVLAQVTTFGPAFRRPGQILAARLFKVGAKIDF